MFVRLTQDAESRNKSDRGSRPQSVERPGGWASRPGREVLEVELRRSEPVALEATSASAMQIALCGVGDLSV